MQIRQATNTDIPGIRQVADVSWHSVYAGILRYDTLASILSEFYSVESLERSLQQGSASLFLVAEENGQLVGFIQALPRIGKSGYELTRLYVLPEYQRQGIGRELQQSIERMLQGQAIWVMVERENPVARSFFEAMGFRSRRSVELPLFGENVSFVEMVKQ